MFKLWYKQLINVDGIKLKHSYVCKGPQSIAIVSSFAFSAIAFPQLLKRDTDMGWHLTT